MTSVAVIGLGYAGSVTAAALASLGHEVIGVDIDPYKVRRTNEGETFFTEAGLANLVSQAVTSGCLRATEDLNYAVSHSEIALVCVGTPPDSSGDLNLEQVCRVSAQLGRLIRGRKRNRPYLVVYRSTLLPGTTLEVLVPALTGLDRRVNRSVFSVAVNPEFLREGSAVKDFFDPPRIVIGEMSADDGNRIQDLYRGVNGPVTRTDIRTAEMIKCVDNAFHALKVAFANEIGALAGKAGIDGRDLMNLFVLDTKLNLSSRYLRPGPPFGGSCLTKDVQALVSLSEKKSVSTPLLSAILGSNQEHLNRIIRLIEELEVGSVGIIGLSFKAGTDDLRESPSVLLASHLIKRGWQVFFFDSDLCQRSIMGRNLQFLESHLGKTPFERSLPISDLVRKCKTVILTKHLPRDQLVLLKEVETIIDLTGQGSCLDEFDIQGRIIDFTGRIGVSPESESDVL